MMKDRRYGGNRLRSPSSPRRRLSPPSAILRDRGYRRDSIDTEDERRRGSYSRRDYERRSVRGNRDYETSYDCGARDYKRNGERGSRYHERNFDSWDRRYGRNFDYGGARVSDFNGAGRDRCRDGGVDAGAGSSQATSRSNIYQSTSDVTGRVFKYREGQSQADSTSVKFQWDHPLCEPKKSEGFRSSIHHGTGGSGMRNELDYGYQESKYFDEGRSGYERGNITASLEAERGRNYSSSSYQMHLGVLHKSSSQTDPVGGFISVPSKFSNSNHKDENFHFPDKPHLDKLVADGPFVGDQLLREANPLPYSRANIDFMASSSRPKAFDDGPSRSLKEEVPVSLISSDGVKFSRGVSPNYLAFDDYGAKPRTRSSVDIVEGLDDFKSYSRPYVADETNHKFSYHEVGRSERSAVASRSLESYGKMKGVGEHYGHPDLSRVDIFDTKNNRVEGSSCQEYWRGNIPRDTPPTSQGQSTLNDYDAHELSYAKRPDVHDQDFGSSQTSYQREFYHGHGSLGELDHDYEVTGSSWYPKNLADRLSPREYDPNLGNIDVQAEPESLLDDIMFTRPSKRMSKPRYETEKHADKHGSIDYAIGGANESWTDAIDTNILSKKLKVTNSKNRKTGKISSLMAHERPCRASPVSMPSHLGEPHRSGTRDIKDRLGPGPRKAHVSQRLTRKFKPSLKRRLGPGPQKSYFTVPPWVKNKKGSKLPRTGDASDGPHLDQGEEPQEHTAKPEPSESSEEFRQMVASTFFKFVKQLNETPAKRRKYKEQGKAGSLKCIVCGSNSDEFEDTESLALHAFTSQKDGVRSQHLGLHKAVCALMGWKSAEAANSVWICETLSHVENSCIREDLILWPPVVIVHNSTITNQNPEQRIIITLENFETRLRDMGFGDKMKVQRGKPANQSIMVVQFGGTLSGLLDAERLHKMYSETKHGSRDHESHSGDTREASIDEVDKILYAYLGTAEDLDKLDFDMKRRCVVKSKKDILNIAEAPLKT